MLSTYPNRALGRSVRASLAALIAIVAVAAFGAANSSAAFTAPYNVKCSGGDIVGQGASFQTVLQGGTINFWRTSTTNTASQTGPCGNVANPPQITYTTSGSGTGRKSFGTDGLGRSTTDRYFGTDEAPTPAEKTLAESAQNSRIGALTNQLPATGAGKLGIVPVASGAVGMIANFPAGCELPSGDANLAPYARFQLTNAMVENVFSGAAAFDTWGEILPGIQAIENNAEEKTTTDCQNQAVIRVVRQDSGGTTFVWKNFLHGVDPSTNWLSFANQAWPNPSTIINNQGVGNGALAQKVANTNGSVGYGDLATLRSKGFQKAQDTTPSDPAAYVYDNGNAVAGYPATGRSYSFNKTLFWVPLEASNGVSNSGTGNYKEPTVSTDAIRTGKRGSNCSGVTYANVPLDALLRPNAFGDWSTVNGTNTLNQFPACTLTYVGFWDDYADVYGNTPTEQAKARTVRDYLLNMVNGGQNTLNQNDYGKLPTDLKNGATSYLNASNWNK